MSTLANALDRLTVEGTLYERLPDDTVRCFACGHRCLISRGQTPEFARCNSTKVEHYACPGVMWPLCNPIPSKETILPCDARLNALTFGMLGCDYHCGYCQNWLTSQALAIQAYCHAINYIRKISPNGMVDIAKRTHASVVVSSYNEPLITSEWAVAIFKEAKAAGLMCAYVSNGNNTPEVMEYIRPYMDAYKVDLKSMNDKNYRKLGGVLQHTLDGIRRAHDLGFWVESLTLTISGFNNSNEELSDRPDFRKHFKRFSMARDRVP